jgi:hypothetical protein
VGRRLTPGTLDYSCPMRTGRLTFAPLALLALLPLAGCGSATSTRPTSLRQLPLVPGGQIVSQAKECDNGSNAFCALEAVVVDRSAINSGALTAAEDRLLHERGWKSSAGDDGVEVAANSPGQKLRVTFATAFDDLIGLDERWIQRAPNIKMALDRTLIERTPAMSVMLEVGPT